ncbi:MAG: DNA-binding response regulator, partial [Spirochaetes bacterium]
MKRILIIEDEPGVQMTLEDRLVVEGYDVTIKGDGLQGEIEALKKTYDIILLDIMLPLRDGYAVCNNIRKAGVDTPVLMLTARNTNMDTVIGLRQGADDYLAKPFDMSVLLARIEALLRRSS